MKKGLNEIMLVTVGALSLACVFSETSRAQNCVPFPSGKVPIIKINYFIPPNNSGDRWVVGANDYQVYHELMNLLPLPNSPNQKFCGLVEIAAGLWAEVYLPTAAEWQGDFSQSSFESPLFAPVTRTFDPSTGEFKMFRYPNNVIPRDALPNPFPWRISSAGLTVAQSIPIVLSSSGANNSFYTSEITLTNRGTTDIPVKFTYQAAVGSGSGVASDLLPAGRQKIFSNGIDYLRSIGVPIPATGDRLGTLTVEYAGLASTALGSSTVRTTTARPEGRAGLSFPGISKWKLTEDKVVYPPSSVYICGLRQDSRDRSNLAVLHAGKAGDNDIVLRLTIISGDPESSSSLTLPDITLSSGEFRQFNSILTSNGLSFTNGYVRIERVSGQAPYYAYGVINDQVTSDGSFIPPVPANQGPLTLPAIVESGAFTSELIVTNLSSSDTTVHLEYVAEALTTTDHTARLDIPLKAGEQSVIPSFVQKLRDLGIPGIGSAGSTYAGALFATPEGIFLGARTSSQTAGGRYGLFYVGVPLEEMATDVAWLYGLQQNDENRTNLALVNTGIADNNPNAFRIELFGGDTGSKVSTIDDITVNAKGWKQIGAILAGNAPGTTNAYARVTRTQGKNPFITYAVINDGAHPGERTGDGAFVSMQVEGP